jgi:hypothetical protein
VNDDNFRLRSCDATLVGAPAWRVSKEGHDVRDDVGAETDAEVADRFVRRTDDQRGVPHWADGIPFETEDDAMDAKAGGHVEDAKRVDRLRTRGYLGRTPPVPRGVPNWFCTSSILTRRLVDATRTRSCDPSNTHYEEETGQGR